MLGYANSKSRTVINKNNLELFKFVINGREFGIHFGASSVTHLMMDLIKKKWR